MSYVHRCRVAGGMTLVDPVDHTRTHNVLAHMEMFRHFQMTLSGWFLCVSWWHYAFDVSLIPAWGPAA